MKPSITYNYENLKNALDEHSSPISWKFNILLNAPHVINSRGFRFLDEVEEVDEHGPKFLCKNLNKIEQNILQNRNNAVTLWVRSPSSPGAYRIYVHLSINS